MEDSDERAKCNHWPGQQRCGVCGMGADEITAERYGLADRGTLQALKDANDRAEKAEADRDALQHDIERHLKIISDTLAERDGLARMLEVLRLSATAKLKDTSCLMSNPPQNAAVWDLRNEIDAALATLRVTDAERS